MTDPITVYGRPFPAAGMDAPMAARASDIRRVRYDWLRAEIHRATLLEDYDRLPALCAEAHTLRLQA